MEAFLLPYETHASQLFDVIFGGIPEDPTKAPRNTVLQRALLERLILGERLHASAGACFLLPEDLNWGQQMYLGQTLP